MLKQLERVDLLGLVPIERPQLITMQGLVPCERVGGERKIQTWQHCLEQPRAVSPSIRMILHVQNAWVDVPGLLLDKWSSVVAE